MVACCRASQWPLVGNAWFRRRNIFCWILTRVEYLEVSWWSGRIDSLQDDVRFSLFLSDFDSAPLRMGDAVEDELGYKNRKRGSTTRFSLGRSYSDCCTVIVPLEGMSWPWEAEAGRRLSTDFLTD